MQPRLKKSRSWKQEQCQSGSPGPAGQSLMGRGSRGNSTEEVGVPRGELWIGIGVRGKTEILA